MRAIILAAGYATRLYPLTLNKAKPLLLVAGQPIINYIVDAVGEIPEISEIFIVSNDKFYKDFCKWQKKYKTTKKITIINDGTKNESDKLGAIGDINLVIQQVKIDDDILVIAGDNLFMLELKEFVNFSKTRGISIASYKYPHEDELSHYGITEINSNSRIVQFQEKPEKPRSNLVATCLYIIPKNKLYTIKEYIDNNNNMDAPGYYLQWLIKKENVFSFVFDTQWHDIGTPDAYLRAQTEYGKLLEKKGIL